MVDLPAPESPVSQSTHGALALERGTRRLVDVDVLYVDIVGAAQRELQHPGAHGLVGQPVDQDEAAGVAVLGVGVESNRLVELELADADLVQLELLCGEMLERVDVDLVLERRDRRGHGLRADLQQVAAPPQHRLVARPDDRGLELVRHLGRRVRGRDDVAARDVEFGGEGQRDRLARTGLREVPALGHDPRHAALLPGRLDPNAIAWLHDAARDGAREPAEVEMRAVDPLDGQAERQMLPARFVDLDGLEPPHERGAAIPRRASSSAPACCRP